MSKPSIKEKFQELKLKSFEDNFSQAQQYASQKNWTSTQLLEYLLDLEIEDRRKRRVELRLRQAKLPSTPTIDSFDFTFHHSRKKQKSLILQLMDLEFIEQKKDIIFIGNPGTGKTFLSKCIGYAGAQKSIKVLFTSVMDMINNLIAAEADHSLLKKLKYYNDPSLLICDEIGFLPLGTQGSNLFFQVISSRHESKSTLLTTNLIFAEWGKIFDSTTVATAIADRLVYNSEVIIFEGESYRKRAKRN